MSKFIFNDVEVEFDNTDLEFLKKYDKAVKNLQSFSAPDDASLLQVTLKLEKLTKGFLNAAIQDGIYGQMFDNNKKSVPEFCKCFAALYCAINDDQGITEAKNELEKQIKASNPPKNREQKRAEK